MSDLLYMSYVPQKCSEQNFYEPSFTDIEFPAEIMLDELALYKALRIV